MLIIEINPFVRLVSLAYYNNNFVATLLVPEKGRMAFLSLSYFLLYTVIYFVYIFFFFIIIIIIRFVVVVVCCVIMLSRLLLSSFFLLPTL